MAALGKRVVNVINLGRMGYMAANDVQMRYARLHLDELAGKASTKGNDMLLLVEHNPVYTIGIRREYYTYEDSDRLKAQGAEFYRTNRGGLITFHGPGQLVAYPVLNLQHFEPSMKWYICALENTLISTCQKFGVTAQMTKDTGVWVEDRKIGAIGVHGSRYVTTHGCSLNSNTDLNWYKHIIPCGIHGKRVTSLSKETGTDVHLNDVITPFLQSFKEVFNCDIEYSLLESHELQALSHNPQISNTPYQNMSSVRQMCTSVMHQRNFKPMW